MAIQHERTNEEERSGAHRTRWDGDGTEREMKEEGPHGAPDGMGIEKERKKERTRAQLTRWATQEREQQLEKAVYRVRFVAACNTHHKRFHKT